jgi:hypothetical protein
MAVSARLRRRIEADFPAAGSSDEVTRLVARAADSERVQAAIVLWASGDMDRLHDVIALTAQDWRDTLVRGELADDGWPDQLDAELGPA